MTRSILNNHRKHDAAVLPCATRKRWQPIRGGLLNLYLYDYEEFRYENGHLILRGNNGTGKSRVMALQLPFLFDGHLAPSRVEPDADPSKRMEWNLLMGRHNERLGYTWIEFGRLSQPDTDGKPGQPISPAARLSSSNGDGHDQQPDSAQRFVTLGCGLSATKGSGMRDPWFFITDQRVGKELFLQSDAGHALSKSALVEAIGETGCVYTTAKEYRQAVDEKLFGLGRQRYDAMVDLLIQLRKPQLSRELNEKMLAGVLGEALPPPSEQMIVDVAESFRGLETDRMELTRFRSACDGVDSFLKTYRHYAAVASRRRAAEVRQSHSRYESANKELHKAEREHAQAGESLASATAKLRSLEINREGLDSQIETLRADPKMRSADTIRLAEEDEKSARTDLQAARHDVRNAASRLEQRKTVQAEARQQAEAQLRTTRDVYRRATDYATACDLAVKHDAVFCGLRLELEPGDGTIAGDQHSMRRVIDDVIDNRFRSLAQLKKRNETLANAESELTRAKEKRDEAQRAVEQAIANERLVEDHRREAVGDFLESYEMWRRDSEELTVPAADDIAADVDQWSQRVDEVSPVANAVRQAELAARERLNGERARIQHRCEALAIEQSAAELLAQKLEQGFHEPPPLPVRADDVARTARPGAAFWTLVDFSASCLPGQRANIEAALEAAGILNAWVVPDGRVLASDFADVLVSGEDVADVAADESLAQVLIPDRLRVPGVFDGVLLGVLQKIGYGHENSQTWIASDGRWRNGPLHGCCQKASAQFIGPDAREEQRIRRLNEVRADLQRMGDETAQLEQHRQLLDGKLVAIDEQVRAVPADSAIRAAATSATLAAQKHVESRKAFTHVEQAVADRRTKADSARGVRDLDARDLGLSLWIDRVDELERKMTAYQRVLAELWPSISHFDSLRTQSAAATASLREAERDLTQFGEKEHNQRARQEKASQRSKTLQQTIGVEVTEILRELGAVTDRRAAVVEEISKAQSEENEAGQQVARMEERISSRREIINAETERRQLSSLAFQQLSSVGLLTTATGESSDEHPSGWSISRTVDLARQTESALSQINADDTSWDRVQEAVTTRIQDLNTALSQHSFTSTLLTSDGLYRVTVPYQGRDRSIQELRDMLSEEVQQRQLILDEREREIIENHLIGEVAAKLHEQIHQAHRLVDQMNAEIQKRPMSTGMTLKFDWKPDEELSAGIVEMCRKLLAATGTWSPTERAAIGRYLQEHIKEVRASRETGAWPEHLAEALDYRRWHRFWVMRKQETGWKRLTKRTHGTGSGGEKAVALTIPQFAAAAAHYSSARDDAPRLILLDEAFVGIDPDMRGKCMELISVFDLDFLLTSEIEWGCYAGLPGVAIHQLSTRSGFDAVFLTRWIWNGKQRTKDETELPPASRPGN